MVACGNFTSRDAQDDLYASTGDAVVLRMMLKKAAEESWDGVSLDVKTAFLNTPWDDMGVLVKPPGLLIKMGLVKEGTVWLPTKALYGFRKSPRLWGNHRDEVLRNVTMKVGQKKLKMVQFVADPNLWKVQEEETEPDWVVVESPIYALCMVYVDDIFAVGQKTVLGEVVAAIQREWKTSEPEWVEEEGVRFLGMEVKKVEIGEEKKGWFATQGNYTRDLLRRNFGEKTETWKKRKIPITREMTPEGEEHPTQSQIREAQRVTGELIWLVTRTRPDLMFAVSKMSTQVLRNPIWVREVAEQVWGYLNSTQGEGILYQPSRKMNPWEEMSGIQTYADASFSPGGEESHGAIVVLLRGAPLIWRSARQATISLSTAESELNELIEGLMMGESVAAILEEMEPGILKLMVSDSQAAVNICLAEGGSWRTRHLRLRAAHARQRFALDWVLQHKPGEEMIADIGTKSLSASRLKMLKEMMNVVRIEKGEQPGHAEDVEEEKDQEERMRREKAEGVEKVLRMVLLMASIRGAKGQREEEQVPWGFWVAAVGVLVLMVVGLVTMGGWVVKGFRRGLRREKKRDSETPEGFPVTQPRPDFPEPSEGISPIQPQSPTPTMRSEDSRMRMMDSKSPGWGSVRSVSQRGDRSRRSVSEPGTSSTDQQTQTEAYVWPSVPKLPGSEGTRSQHDANGDQSGVRKRSEAAAHRVHGGQEGLTQNPGSTRSSVNQEGESQISQTPDRSGVEGSNRGTPSAGKGGQGGPNTPTTTSMPQEPLPGWRVYITRYGTRYHPDAQCPSLNRTRNLTGSRKCYLCGTNDAAPGRVYGTGPGCVVHERADCPAFIGNRMTYPRCMICG